MTGHLDLDELADTLAGADEPVRAVRPGDDHLAGCSLCQARLSALRAQSTSVTSALAGPTVAVAATGGMPADVDARVTAALSALERSESPAARPDELAVTRAGRRRRRRPGLAAAAAVVLVVGVGVPTAVHLAHQNSSASSEQGSSGSAADAAAGAAGGAAGTAADPTALSSVSFASDVDRLLASRTATPSAGVGKHAAAAAAGATCRRLASAAAATALAGTPTPVVEEGKVTVDGTPAQLFVVGDHGRQAAVAVSGCSTGSPSVIATGVL